MSIDTQIMCDDIAEEIARLESTEAAVIQQLATATDTRDEN